jgi:hypothetical protein
MGTATRLKEKQRLEGRAESTAIGRRIDKGIDAKSKGGTGREIGHRRRVLAASVREAFGRLLSVTGGAEILRQLDGNGIDGSSGSTDRRTRDRGEMRTTDADAGRLPRDAAATN